MINEINVFKVNTLGRVSKEIIIIINHKCHCFCGILRLLQFKYVYVIPYNAYSCLLTKCSISVYEEIHKGRPLVIKYCHIGMINYRYIV